MAKVQTVTTLVASSTKAAGTVTRGRWDVSTLDGGMLTLAITNGATAPTTQAVGRILYAHKQGSLPAAASEGVAVTDWKIVAEFGGTLLNSQKTPQLWVFGPEVAYIEVEFSAHVGNDVTVEAYGTGYVY